MRDLGQEFRDKRLQIGLSQLAVAKAARISRSSYSRIEAGKRHSLTVLVAARIGVVLGLDLAVKPYPGGEPLRDAASARLIKFVCDHVGMPIRARTEVPLPQRTDHPEQRRWDVMLRGADKRTGMEFEMRLYDAQAQRGRWALKFRDDPVDSFVVVLADTGRNREVLEQYDTLFLDLPRMGPATFLKMLKAGQHPPTCLVLLPSVPLEHHPEKTPSS